MLVLLATNKFQTNNRHKPKHMHINQLKESKFLKKEDCGPGILVTIAKLTEENMAMEGEKPDMKWCVHFMEDVKPLALGSTNAQLIAAAVGSEETDNWAGKKIVVYSDPTIVFKGKVTGGIRVRAPRNVAPAAKEAPATAPKPATPATDPVPDSTAAPGEPPSEDGVPF